MTPDRTLSLFTPGLFGPDRPHPETRPVRDPSLPALERLLARGDRGSPVLPGPDASALFRLFGMPVPDTGDLPIAAIGRICDSGAVDHNWWIRADPVFLEPQGDGLVLHAGPALELSESDARSLAASISKEYQPDGWLLEAYDPLRWYLRPPTAPDQLVTGPLAAVSGRDIGAFLPSGASGPAWRRLLNETQLLLHAHPVNERRQRHGLRPINSLWFWGGGCIPAPTTAPRWSDVWTSDPLAGGLARLCGTVVRPPVQQLSQWLSGAGPGEHLVVLQADQRAAHSDGYDDWMAWVTELEHHWFAPAIVALRERRTGALGVHVAGHRSIDITQAHLWRWWRRRRTLNQIRAVDRS